MMVKQDYLSGRDDHAAPDQRRAGRRISLLGLSSIRHSRLTGGRLPGRVAHSLAMAILSQNTETNIGQVAGSSVLATTGHMTVEIEHGD